MQIIFSTSLTASIPLLAPVNCPDGLRVSPLMLFIPLYNLSCPNIYLSILKTGHKSYPHPPRLSPFLLPRDTLHTLVRTPFPMSNQEFSCLQRKKMTAKILQNSSRFCAQCHNKTLHRKLRKLRLVQDSQEFHPKTKFMLNNQKQRNYCYPESQKEAKDQIRVLTSK